MSRKFRPSESETSCNKCAGLFICKCGKCDNQCLKPTNELVSFEGDTLKSCKDFKLLHEVK